MSHRGALKCPESENKNQRKVFVQNKLMECLPRSSCLPPERLRWNTTEEIASFLVSVERHDEWLCCSLKTRPKNGSIILYNRKKVKYRKDGYSWKKRKDGKTTREDHMKLKVQGMECLYGCYVHSSIVPTFHRRCYWLLQNPDIVLVHYLNVPTPEDSGKCSPLICAERHSSSTRWSREDLLSQLKPMFHSVKVPPGDLSIEDLVQHILDRQRSRPQPRTHACLCNHATSGANIPHRCNTKHRIISPKLDKTKPAPIKSHCPAPSPHPPTSSSSPSPPHTAIAVGNYTDRLGNLTTVALPQNAVIVVAATPPTASNANNNSNKTVALIPLLTPPTQATPPPRQSTPPPCQITPPPCQATPPPAQATALQTLALPAQTTPPGPQSTPPSFDPDAFLNSPKQGQTYGRQMLSNQNSALAPSPASSLSSLSSTDSAPLVPDSSPLVLPLCLELDNHETAKNRRNHSGSTVALIQSICGSPPRRQSSAPLLLVGYGSPPTDQPQASDDLTHVKQESGRRGSDIISVDTAPPRSISMDTDAVEEAELDLSFDSPFPDLISDLIGDDTSTAPSLALATPPLATGVRYMVPPTPSPSSSFLPFPQPRPSPRTATITDFSPEWSYPEGGVKVLITGSWSESSARYSCVFDQSVVPASLIQPGVLRCYCPAHQAGLVCLQVLESGGSVSSSVLFEYRARNASSLPSSQLDWLSLDDNQFRMSILERLEQMEQRMTQMTSRETHQYQHQGGNQLSTGPPLPPSLHPPQTMQTQQWFEQRIVGLCERMMKSTCWWSSSATAEEGRASVSAGGGAKAKGGGDRLNRSATHRGMTLLHLAAAQGYTQLIYKLICWRCVHRHSLELEQEVDPLNVDHFSCTPLMWACALGHQASAELLYSWSSSALGIPDSLGRLPLAVARSRGHTRLATALERLHMEGRARGDEGERTREEQEARSPVKREEEQQHSATEELGGTRKRGCKSEQGGQEKHLKAEETREQEERRTHEEEARRRDEEVERSRQEQQQESISVDPEEPRLTLSEPESRDLSLDSPQALSPLSTSPDTGLSSSSRLSSSNSSSPSPFDSASSSSLSSAYSSIGLAPMDTSPPESPSDSPDLLWGVESQLMDFENSPPPHVHSPGHRAHSSLQQFLSLSENNENEDLLEDDELQVDVAALAEQIIEATPERIKREDFPLGAESALRERQDNPDLQDTWLGAYLETVDPPRRLRPPSPLSALALHRLRPPSSAAWAEFLNASANGKIERDFALLTLTDGEQRELYEAARIIQTAFRRYKGRRLKEQQDMAAAVIQRCYRKYKQYALYKKMTQAAILIQSKFRSYYEQKRFQQSRRAAVLIQQYYRSYKEYERKRGGAKDRGSFLTKKQDQAARKIMRFLRRCRHRIAELKQSRELERRGLTT
uniref:CG-1 domain-containing protein n=1 Tax=Knipowitschia caucasica TaxID=637954 RepID=A0AAV2KP71_KNICA